MKLSDIKGARGFEVLGEIIEPILTIFQDQEIRDLLKTNRVKGISAALKKYKNELLLIMAVLDGKEVETYNPDIMKIAANIGELLNDPAVLSLFISAGQTTETSSGSASESTEA